MGFNPQKAEKLLQGIELQEKNKDGKYIGKLIRKTTYGNHQQTYNLGHSFMVNDVEQL